MQNLHMSNQIVFTVPVHVRRQCFGSIFIESGSSKKFQSGSRRTLNPDPSYFLTLSEQKLNLFHNYKTLSQKKSIKSHLKVQLCCDLTFLTFFLSPWIRIRNIARTSSSVFCVFNTVPDTVQILNTDPKSFLG